jgi:CRP/FNR family cyclic AMP-dependent transcriptional regulator
MGIFRNQKERAAAIGQVAIFSGLSQADLMAIQRHSTESTLPKGSELAVQDRAPKQMLILIHGSAIVRRNNRKLATLGPGDTIGELSLLDGGKQTATVVADSEVDVLVVSVSEFRTLLADSPGFTQKMLKSLAGHLRQADRHLAP